MGHFIILLMFAVQTANPEIIDRIVAVVNGQIITLSDIREERAVQDVLGELPPDNDDAALQNLIEGILIEEQLAQFPGVEAEDEEIRAEMAGIQNTRNIPLEVLVEAIRRRIRAEEYFDLRFRQFISVSAEEAQQYYQNVFVPAARKRGVDPPPPFEEVAPMVEENVLAEKMNRDIENWLTAVRGRSEIEVFD